MNVENSKAVNISLNLNICFYEKEAKPNTWGNNDIAYEIYYNQKDGIMSVSGIEEFGDRTLLKRFQDKKGRGITLDEILENIQEITKMTYQEFKEKILKEVQDEQ